jgi:protein-tyrosine phosphatase
MAKQCIRCNLHWHSFYDIDGSIVCEMCKESYKCVMCNILLFPNITAAACEKCWNTLGISKIDDGLYLCDHLNARKYDKLKELGVKQILSIGAELEPHSTADFTTRHIKIDDHHTENIRQYFDETYDFIDRQPTVVHCYAGISRSASIVIAYLIRKKMITLADAITLCRDKRPVVNPNIGFMQQLEIFESNVLRQPVVDYSYRNRSYDMIDFNDDLIDDIFKLDSWY